MKKVLIGLLILVGVFPYLFLGSSVEKVEKSSKEYKCTVSKPYRYKSVLGFGRVYYDTGKILKNKNIILPYFFIDEQVFNAECGSTTLIIGKADFIKEGEKIYVYTDTQKVSLFGFEILREESISMFSTE